jgi:hypothetical protein
MSDNVFSFPGNKTSGHRPPSISSSERPYRIRGEKNRYTLLFRSREFDTAVRRVSSGSGRLLRHRQSTRETRANPSAPREPAGVRSH